MPVRKSTAPKPEKNKSLEQWIWDAACSIRGAKDAPKYKDFILPLIFTKRLCDVFDDELNRIAAGVGSRKEAFQLAKRDHELDRFPAGAGFPGKSSADWGWTQHIFASLKADGRAAVVWDTGAVSRGSGNAGDNKEKTVRQWFVDRDLVESVRSETQNLWALLKQQIIRNPAITQTM